MGKLRISSEYASVEDVRKAFPVGTKVMVDRMDDPRPIPAGTVGVVDMVNDLGDIHCKFTLASGEVRTGVSLIVGVDEFHKV